MKALRTLLGMVLIVLILGGIGYIAWMLGYIPNNFNIQGLIPPSNNTPNNTQTTPNNTDNMPGHSMGPATSSNMQNFELNAIALQNKDRLNQIIESLSDTIDQITIDPYAKVTVPGNAGQNMQMQLQGNAPINVYPSGTNTINVTPAAGTAQNNQTTAQGTMTPQPMVVDQGKLEQLHSGIFRLSQGMMALNELNDDLTVQATLRQDNISDYQKYINIYNTALSNKTKFNNAVSLISSATTLVNVNPYGSANGYQFDPQGMQQLHQGVYNLAQAMRMTSRLNQDFTNQMVTASALASNASSIGNINMSMPSGSIFGSVNITLIFGLILIIMIVGLIIGMLGAIGQVFNTKKKD